MGSKLLNVRLDEARLRKARRLRERGIALSDVVREAIDARFAALEPRLTAQDVRGALARIADAFPDPPDRPARTYDVHDRRASRDVITRRLTRRAR
jgi:hypothetical protein